MVEDNNYYEQKLTLRSIVIVYLINLIICTLRNLIHPLPIPPHYQKYREL